MWVGREAVGDERVWRYLRAVAIGQKARGCGWLSYSIFTSLPDCPVPLTRIEGPSSPLPT